MAYPAQPNYVRQLTDNPYAVYPENGSSIPELAPSQSPVLGPDVGAGINEAYKTILRRLALASQRRYAARDLTATDLETAALRREQQKQFDRNSESYLSPFLSRGFRQSGATQVGQSRFFQDRMDNVSNTNRQQVDARQRILDPLASAEAQAMIEESMASRGLLPSAEQIKSLFGL